MQIWDTAGQERFKTVTSAYYRGADGIIIVYDTTDRASFEHLTDWLDDIEKYTADKPVTIVVGNKDDLKDSRMISDDDIKAFQDKTGIEGVQASAKSSHMVSLACEKLTMKLMNVREKKEVAKGYSLEPTPIEGRFANKNNCCQFN